VCSSAGSRASAAAAAAAAADDDDDNEEEEEERQSAPTFCSVMCTRSCSRHVTRSKYPAVAASCA
jgi:hypothetical protein